MNLGRPRILVPAYGRKYKTESEAVKDYLAGKDFRIESGPYCSCRDFPGYEISICWAYVPNRYAVVTAII